jgi:hypothetical protein
MQITTDVEYYTFIPPALLVVRLVEEVLVTYFVKVKRR